MKQLADGNLILAKNACVQRVTETGEWGEMKKLHIAKPLVLTERTNFNPRRNEILMLLNHLAEELIAVEDHQISLLNFGQLMKYEEFLLQQAARFQGYKVKPGSGE